MYTIYALTTRPSGFFSDRQRNHVNPETITYFFNHDVRETTIRKISGIGAKYASIILKWQKTAEFSPETEWVSDMIQQDAERVLALHKQI